MPSLNLMMNDKAWGILEELAKKHGKSKSEILRNALTLMYLTDQESTNNRSLAFIDNDTEKAATRIVNIF